MIAKIAVSTLPFAVDKPYSYRIPATMTLEPGLRVIVPFGRGNRRVEGVVLTVEAGGEDGLKAVETVLDPKPILTPQMLSLAAFLRERCFCSFYECLRAMLPAGLWFQERNVFRLTQDQSWKEAPCRQKNALTILRALEEMGGEAEEQALRRILPEEDTFAAALQYLLRKKWIAGRTDYERGMRDRTEKIATLAASAEETMAFAAGRPRSAAMQRSVLETMCSVGCASVKELCYYTGAGIATIKRLEKLGYLTLSERPVLRCREIRPAQLHGPLELNVSQQAAFAGLSGQMDNPEPGSALLYGVTGSGKTAVYLKLVRKCLDEGKSALFLVPEIALTPQLLSLLAACFGELVALQHSSLSARERYDQWKRIQTGEAKVIVGTRSAVFAPAQNLGLIVVDEEQEHSYRSENAPRYDAREVALWRGFKEKALVLFGSATPSVETMYRTQSGKCARYTLTGRYNGKPMPRVDIVDMRKELESGNDLSLSSPLLERMEENRRNRKQTILFLNRRGNSRAVVCIGCGTAPECPRCGVRLVYHSANERLMCHYCGFSQPTPVRCPCCGGALKRIGTGTQKVQQELLEQFPDLTVERMDADTVSAVNTHEKILERFQADHMDVLLGTQMVAKGLNLPDVTLVGVLDADLGLYASGYRAAETTFNMLTQVVGRAGRGDTPGHAVIQTLVPEHPVIRLAAKQDYDGFYALELNIRRVQKFPPFGDLAAIVFSGQEETAVLRGAMKFRQSLLDCRNMPAYQSCQWSVLGPAPCAVPKINYHFRYRLTLRCHLDRQLRRLLAYLLRQFAQDKENRGVSAFIDVNGPEE